MDKLKRLYNYLKKNNKKKILFLTKDFNLSLERDKKKMDYCRDKNINIIIIKYNDNIDTELSKLIYTT